MRTRQQIEDEIRSLGWFVIDGPTPTPGGFKATIQHGPTFLLTTGATTLEVMEALLDRAKKLSQS